MFYFNCVEFSVTAGNAESVISPKVVTLFDVKQWKLLLTVSCVGLIFGTEKFKVKVETLRHSKPNLTALFSRQRRRNC